MCLNEPLIRINDDHLLLLSCHMKCNARKIDVQFSCHTHIEQLKYILIGEITPNGVFSPIARAIAITHLHYDIQFQSIFVHFTQYSVWFGMKWQ